MTFDMTTPCDSCPFVRGAFQGLREERVYEIAENALGPQGGTFACHKTTTAGGAPRGSERHCAGALIFAEKHEQPTQMMRICERLGQYDYRKLTGHETVFDSVDEMVEAFRD